MPKRSAETALEVVASIKEENGKKEIIKDKQEEEEERTKKEKPRSKKSKQKHTNTKIRPATISAPVCPKIITTILRVSVMPRAFEDIGQYLQTELNKKLNRYCDEVNGIVLSFESVGLDPRNPNGRIIEDLPFITFDIQATMNVLQIKRKCYIRGKVTKVDDAGLGLLVEGQFNASILPSRISKTLFRFNMEKNIWEGKKKKKNESSFDIHEYDEIDFEVLSMEEAGGLIHIHGSLGEGCKMFSRSSRYSSISLDSPVAFASQPSSVSSSSSSPLSSSLLQQEQENRQIQSPAKRKFSDDDGIDEEESKFEPASLKSTSPSLISV